MDDASAEPMDLTEEEQMLQASYEAPMKLRVKRKSLPALPKTEISQASAAAAGAASTATTAGSGAAVAAPGPVKRPRLVIVSQEGAKIDSLIAPAPSSAPAALPLDPSLYLVEAEWDSSTQSFPLVVELSGLNLDEEGAKNSVVVSATMPEASKRFAVNLCPNQLYNTLGAKNPGTRVLYHFNPRVQRDAEGNVRRETVRQNCFVDGTWGNEESLVGFPLSRGKRFDLRITIAKQGFEVYVDGHLVSEFRHRLGLPPSPLFLQVPVSEDSYGDPELVCIHSVWWGHLKPSGLISRTPAAAAAAAPAPFGAGMESEERTLFVAGLPRDGTAAQELLRLFEHYDIETKPDGSRYIQVDSAQGSGLVKLTFDINVSRAVENLHGRPSTLPGATLVVVRAKKRQVKW